MRFLLTLLAAFLGTLTALFFLVLLVVGLISATGDSTPSVERASVLELRLSGALPDTPPLDPFAEAFGGPITTLPDVTEALEKAAADSRIEAVWLRPDGLATSWAVAAEVRQALEAYRASGKPLYASSGPDGFSELGYYLASAADSIFSAPEAGFEMNGFAISSLFFGGAFERYGIEPVVLRAGEYKSAAENFTDRQFSPENREQLAAVLRTFDDQYRETVAAARGIPRATIDAAINDGGVYTAREAATLGLIDALRYERQVEDALRGHTGQDADEELRTTSLRTYRRVTRRDAGLEPGDRRTRIAVVRANGAIFPGRSGGDGFGSTTLGSETFIETIEEARRDERVRAMVIRVDSPGGSATASDAMWAAVRDVAAEMPVVVSMGSVAASGGYYIAAPASAIVAERSTITGSIGVIGLLLDAQSFLEQQFGVTVDTVRTAPAAGLGSLPIGDEDIRIFEEQIARIYDVFIDRVATGRNLPADSVRALAGGRIWSGEDALAVGLVDRVGSLNDAVALAAEMAELEPGGYQRLVLPRERPLFERLTEQFAQATAPVAMRFLPQPSPTELALRRQAARLDQLTRTSGVPLMRLVDEWIIE